MNHTSLILYTDGGARNRIGEDKTGFGGIGVFGYTYSLPTTEYPKTKSEIIHYTTEGFELKKKANVDNAVRVGSIISLYRGIAPPVKSHYCEILGILEAFSFVKKSNFDKVLIYCDSKSTVEGINKNLYKWIENGWKNRKGEAIECYNEWIKIKEYIDYFIENKIVVKVEWIESNNVANYGNTIADGLATKAIKNARIKNYDLVERYIDPNEEDPHDVDPHAFLAHNSLIFNTDLEQSHQACYHLTNYNKISDLICKPDASTGFAYIELKEPDIRVEEIKVLQNKISGEGRLAIIFLKELLSKKNTELIKQFKEDNYSNLNDRENSIYNVVKSVIGGELNPPGLALNSIEIFNSLEIILDAFVNDSKLDDISFTEITDQLYETINKKIVLKKEIKNGINKIAIKNNEGKNITLLFGVDILSRNSLKRIEKNNPKLYLVTHRLAPKLWRYYTIASIEDAIGIWAGVYSNYLLN